MHGLAVKDVEFNGAVLRAAQVEDIVKRKTNIAADKIVITPIVVDESGE